MPNYIALEQAAKQISKTHRVLVIGCSGGGKSTLSLKLSQILSLEYISIDRDIRWLPGWVVRDEQEQRQLWQALVQDQRWIMDGTSPGSFDIRLPRTQLVLWVRVPRYLAFIGLFRRVLRYYGTTRPEMAEGCNEPLPDLEFLSYIWNFEKHSSPRVIKNLDLYGPTVPVLILNSRREMAQLIKMVEAS